MTSSPRIYENWPAGYEKEHRKSMQCYSQRFCYNFILLQKEHSVCKHLILGLTVQGIVRQVILLLKLIVVPKNWAMLQTLSRNKKKGSDHE